MGGVDQPINESTPWRDDAASDLSSVAVVADSSSFFDGDALPMALGSLARVQSLEKIVPPPECPTRESSSATAVLNLLATIVGGGILSLPWAIDACGLGLGVGLMVTSAVASDFTVYILVASARRVGATSFADIAGLLWGATAETGVSFLLFGLTLFVLIANAILISDVATLLFRGLGIFAVAGYHDDDDGAARDSIDKNQRAVALAGVLVLIGARRRKKS